MLLFHLTKHVKQLILKINKTKEKTMPTKSKLYITADTKKIYYTQSNTRLSCLDTEILNGTVSLTHLTRIAKVR